MVKMRNVSVATVLAVVLTACSASVNEIDVQGPIDIPDLSDVLGPGQVRTEQGVVEGAFEGDLLVFRGVRFAAPPVGDLRFKNPVPPIAFAGVRETKEFGEPCIQPQGATVAGSEDCLFLNIWTRDDDVSRPVIVYLHPGAANGVGGQMASIQPDNFVASSEIVAVTFNRRIAILGHLALDELVTESPIATAGNYALVDVLAALQWVQDNIAEFGGDPNRVMLAGTSSGGLTTCAILGSPSASGLISAAAIQSAPCSPRMLQARDDTVMFDSRYPAATTTHRAILAPLGCDTAADIPACLRARTAEEIIQAGLTVEFANPWIVFGPMVDDVVVVDEPRAALANMTAGDVPVIVGLAENEIGNQFDSLVLPDDASYRNHLASIFPDPTDDELYALYPTADYASPKQAFETLWSDLFYSCAAEWMAREGQTGASVYLYEITRGFDTGSNAGQGAYHAIDTAYLFGNYDVFGVTPDAQSLAIMDAMRAAWVGLATDPTGAPPISTDGTTLWPAYSSTDAAYSAFGDTIEAAMGHRGGRCAGLFALFD